MNVFTLIIEKKLTEQEGKSGFAHATGATIDRIYRIKEIEEIVAPFDAGAQIIYQEFEAGDEFSLRYEVQIYDNALEIFDLVGFGLKMSKIWNCRILIDSGRWEDTVWLCLYPDGKVTTAYIDSDALDENHFVITSERPNEPSK